MFKFILKTISALGLFFAAAFLITASYVYYFGATHDTMPASLDTQPYCAVVFGAAVWPGGVPSDALADRIFAGVTLYERGVADCLILSGAASAYDAHEVDVMHGVAREAGIPEEVLRTDYDGKNTLTTLAHLQKGGAYIFVSNDFHLARISFLAKRLSLNNFELYAAPYQNGRYIKEFEFVMREAAALWYYAFMLR